MMPRPSYLPQTSYAAAAVCVRYCDGVTPVYFLKNVLKLDFVLKPDSSAIVRMVTSDEQPETRQLGNKFVAHSADGNDVPGLVGRRLDLSAQGSNVKIQCPTLYTGAETPHVTIQRLPGYDLGWEIE